MENTKISFIGCGNMGRSLIGGIIANGHNRECISGADPDATQRNLIKQQFQIEVSESGSNVIDKAKVVVLAVKPQAMQQTLTSIKEDLLRHQPLIISIAAGIRIETINKWLGQDLAIARVMPNTPALIKAGVAALYANERVNYEQRELAESLMRSVGTAIWLEREELMDAVTALSGSGPAYFFLVLEVLEKAAVALGLPLEQARLLAIETGLGAAKMAVESDLDAATLRQQVTSPGGTTEKAVKVLMEGGIEKLFHDALTSARDRSVELAELFGEKS